MQGQDLKHFYEFGDVYETLDTCEELERQIGRLKRQRLLDDDAWTAINSDVTDIRTRLQDFVSPAALKPRGPRLP